MRKTALITGASGGLGEEFAKLFAADGYDLVLVARSEDKLKTLALELEKQHSITATVLPTDLSVSGAAAKIFEELTHKNIVITALVNNAGFGAYGLFHETDYTQERELLQVNVVALTDLTKLLLPQMVKGGFGEILNVASTAAFPPGPLMAVYYASKAYVMSLSLALSVELEKTGVTVTCLCPGPTRTGFASHAGMAKSKLFQHQLMNGATVAKIGYRALKRGKPLVVSGFINAIEAFMTRLVPRTFAARVARMAQSPQS